MVAGNPVQRSCADILADCESNAMPPEKAIAQLTGLLQASPAQALAFGIDIANAEKCQAYVADQLTQYRRYRPSFCQLCQETLHITPYPTAILWNLWLPLAIHLVQLRHSLGRPVIQGVLGGQGTGKTTLAIVLTHLLTHMGYRVCGFSIDDIYKTHHDRQKLMESDPRLRWRGPPGTHDVELGLQVLRKIKHVERSGSIAIPRFDKSLHDGSGDRIAPEYIEGADIVLFEGWFVGARPIDPGTFDAAPSPINTDADRQFARDINTRLVEYLPLWEELDELMVLYPTDYRLSQQWRQQAEDKMKAAGKTGMSDEDIQAFVEYFWRSLHPEVFITPLLYQPDYVDLIVQINPDRSIHSIYRPAQRPKQ